MTRRLVQAYKLVSPTDEVFYAAIVLDGGEVVVETTRPFGNWNRDPLFTISDLTMPEQQFEEWDIREIPIDQLPEAPVS